MRVSHGRARRRGRAPIVGPVVAKKRRRSQLFVDTVEGIVDYLRKIAGDELREVSIVIQAMPDQPDTVPGVARWQIDRPSKTIRLFRIPIERLGHHHPGDRWYERMVIESVVIRAVAEYLGTDPWRLTPGREPWD